VKLQKNTTLALYSAIEFAAHPGRHLSAAEIAARHGVSVHHLAKVLSELARAGILESVRGVGGGYRFVGNARRLTLMDVIARFEDIDGTARPHTAEAATPAAQALAAIESEIDEWAKATFRSITLETMLRLIERQARSAAGTQRSRSR
jgi:Rrf2 family protein